MLIPQQPIILILVTTQEKENIQIKKELIHHKHQKNGNGQWQIVMCYGHHG